MGRKAEGFSFPTEKQLRRIKAEAAEKVEKDRADLAARQAASDLVTENYTIPLKNQNEASGINRKSLAESQHKRGSRTVVSGNLKGRNVGGRKALNDFSKIS